MEDFFLQYSKGMSNENLSMRKAALAAMPSGPVPCTTSSRRMCVFDIAVQNHTIRQMLLPVESVECGELVEQR